eukprot:5533451-Heterocapsa_arctica.AAC.1
MVWTPWQPDNASTIQEEDVPRGAAPGPEAAQASVQPPVAPPPRLGSRREGPKRNWLNPKTQEYRDFQRECHATPGCKACNE